MAKITAAQLRDLGLANGVASLDGGGNLLQSSSIARINGATGGADAKLAFKDTHMQSEQTTAVSFQPLLGFGTVSAISQCTDSAGHLNVVMQSGHSVTASPTTPNGAVIVTFNTVYPQEPAVVGVVSAMDSGFALGGSGPVIGSIGAWIDPNTGNPALDGSLNRHGFTVWFFNDLANPSSMPTSYQGIDIQYHVIGAL